MKILIHTKIDPIKQAALVAVIQDLEANAAPQQRKNAGPSNWSDVTKLRKSPQKAN